MNGNRNMLRLLGISDFLTVGIGWFCFNVVRYRNLPIYFPGADSFMAWFRTPQVEMGQAFVPLAMLMLYAVSGAYNRDSRVAASRLDCVVNTLGVSLLGALGLYFAVLMNDNIPERMASYELIMCLYGLLVLPTLICRLIIVARITKMRKLPQWQIPAVIVGAVGRQTRQTQKLIEAAASSGLRIVGIADMCESSTQKKIGDYNVCSDWRAEVSRPDIEAIVVLPDEQSDSLSASFIENLYGLNKTIYITPDFYGILSMKPRVISVRPEPLVELTATPIAPATANIKRLADVFLSALALLLLLPVYLLIALVVSLGSKGNPLYCQERIGLRGKPFKILKFRTMVENAEANGPALSSADDNRITPVGKILRKYRIDELPQFWNVFVGDMSLVGPRPEREFFIRQIILRHPSYALLHQVRPGLTSWGMVKFGYASNVDEMIERMKYDILYIQNVGLSIDLKILLHTISTVITGKGI